MVIRVWEEAGGSSSSAATAGVERIMLTALSEGTTARGGNVRRWGEQVVAAGDVSMCERLARAWWRGRPTRSASSPPGPL